MKTKHYQMRKNRILDIRTKVLEKDINNIIYVGTNIGLYEYTKNGKVNFLGDAIHELKLSINSLFYDDENNMLLVGTSSKGLVLLENKKMKFNVTLKTGLNNNTITSIEKVKNNKYLIGTNKGINLLIIQNNKIKVKNYNPKLGFKNQKINAISYTSDTTYIATNNGLIYFNYEYLKKKRSKPIIYINNIYANNKKVEERSKFKINYNTNDIEIDVTGISFLDEGNLDFYFQLNNNDWKKTKDTKINYQSLPSNSYKFSIYAINSFKEKSYVKTITFKIKKPFWETWWFIVLAMLFLGFLIYSFITLRLKYVKEKYLKEKKSILLEKENIELENKMLALEQKALRLQMNPHFIFNALNTIKGYYSEGSVQVASNYISNFSKLLRLLLENIEQYIPLSLEVEMLDLYLQLTQVRYHNNFDYQIIIDKNLKAKETSIPTLLMQPIIENAVIHGISPKSSKGKIIVSFYQKEKSLICVVSDDGIGRKASQKNKKTHHTSKAISITKERLDLIEVQEKVKCNLEFIDLIKNKKSTGTKVIITIPHLKFY